MRLLFVCMGNICRSPTAEGVFRNALSADDLYLVEEIDSAGTHAYHVGEPPDHRAIAAARSRGIDLSALRARAVENSDFERFDLILAMDKDNVNLLRQRAANKFHARIKLIMDFAPDAFAREVPDPYYGGAKGFEAVLDLLEQATQGLIRELRKRERETKSDE